MLYGVNGDGTKVEGADRFVNGVNEYQMRISGLMVMSMMRENVIRKTWDKMKPYPSERSIKTTVGREGLTEIPARDAQNRPIYADGRGDPITSPTGIWKTRLHTGSHFVYIEPNAQHKITACHKLRIQ